VYIIDDSKRARVLIASPQRIVTEYIVPIDAPEKTGLQAGDMECLMRCMMEFGCSQLTMDIVCREFVILIEAIGIAPSGSSRSIVWNPSEICIESLESRSTRTHGVKYKSLKSGKRWYLKEEWH
jgi:hypothetical protein